MSKYFTIITKWEIWEKLSKPQPNLNTRLGLTIKWLCTTPPHPTTTETQCQQYLSCYWPDFDETLKVGSCEHLEQIPTIRVTFVQATFVLRHLSISGISQLLLTRFWWNFTGRFLGTSWTDSNCHSGICPGNICPSNICSGLICTYQEYLSCYWHDLD